MANIADDLKEAPLYDLSGKFCPWPWSGWEVTRDQISEILPGKLFLTNYRGADNLPGLQAAGISHVLCVNSQENTHEGTLVYKNIDNVTDDDDQAAQLLEHFEGAFAFIDGAFKDGSAVVVHCAAGISRSTAIVLAYLMGRCSMDLLTAFTHTIARRRVVWPNDGFMERLIAYEADLRGKTTIQLPDYVRWAVGNEKHVLAAKTVDRP